MIGSTIAHYRITAKLGEGGMGEVYRATDDRLNRDVAIKLLPASVEQDPARLARFKREAQTLASLSHGNIAQVFGLEEQDGKHAIVLELVDGEDLSERIKRGPLSLEDTRDIALQIAEALEAAHAKGIVHRDLKPANIKLASDGTVKVLDFGLAKALAGDVSDSDIATSPTMTAAATMAGIILGTASYMAPEQAKGKPVDRRADVWAFGVVVYEMLCGRRPFEGEGVSEVLAHVITQEPDLDALPGGLPGMLRELLERCLRKDPRQRVPDIAVARITLQELDEDSDVAETAPPVRPPRGILVAWWLPGTIGLLLGLAVAWGMLSGGAPATTSATHFDLVLDPPHVPGPIAISSDGRLLVYSGLVEGTRQLFVRPLDGHTSQALPDTEGGYYPFLSPDDRHVGFFAGGRLKRVSLAGGLPEALAPAPGAVTGAVWAPDDTIVFSTPVLKVPHRVDADGGQATPLKIDGAEDSKFRHPTLLPDGRTLLLTRDKDSSAEVEVILLQPSGEWRTLVRGFDARFVPPDRLLFVQQERVMTTRFDPSTGEIAGDPQPAELYDPSLVDNDGVIQFNSTLAANGTLVYSSGTFAASHDVLRVSVDGETQSTGLTGFGPRADSTGRRVVVTASGGAVHLLDLVSGTDTPLTFSDTAAYPLWSHDDTAVLFGDRRALEFEVFSVAADGSGRAERLFESPVPTAMPTSVAPDGTLMGYGVHPVTSRDIFVREIDGEIKVILETQANERAPQIAPVGRLFAYVSDEEGSDQIYLRDLDALERRWRVTSDGGLSPAWSRDGRQLYFVRGNSIFAVDVGIDGGIRIGEERRVFLHERLTRDDWGNRVIDTLPGGELLVSVRQESDVMLRVVLGFGGDQP
jgi:serine/threonine-protein kinase